MRALEKTLLSRITANSWASVSSFIPELNTIECLMVWRALTTRTSRAKCNCESHHKLVCLRFTEGSSVTNPGTAGQAGGASLVQPKKTIDKGYVEDIRVTLPSRMVFAEGNTVIKNARFRFHPFDSLPAFRKS